MIRRPPRSTRTDTLFPYTTLFRSADAVRQGLERGGAQKRIVFPELIFHRLRDDRNQRFPGVQSGFPGLFAEIPQPLVAVAEALTAQFVLRRTVMVEDRKSAV